MLVQKRWITEAVLIILSVFNVETEMSGLALGKFLVMTQYYAGSL